MIDVEIGVQSDGYIEHGQALQDLEWILNQTIIDLVGQTHQELFSQFRKRPGGVYLSDDMTSKPSRGNYSAHIVSTMVNSLHGNINDGGVIYGPWLEGISARNATSRFKGYAVWRKTAQVIAGRAVSTFARIAASRGWRAQ